MTPRDQLAALIERVEAPIPEDVVREIAKDIGAAVSHHIETMYPEAFNSVSRNMLTSVRNAVFNEIMAALKEQDVDRIHQRLAARKAHRREINRLRSARLAGMEDTDCG